jgi:Skp family chaperone for outer membrane proteins
MSCPRVTHDHEIKQGVLTVNTRFLRITAAVCSVVALISSGSAIAQGPSRSSIVIIDVAKVFKEHARLAQAMKILGDEVKAYDGYLREQQEVLKKLAEERQQYKAGTPKYKELDIQITRKQSDLQVEMQLKKKTFMEREAKQFFNTYTEVTQAVAKFADANEIRLVLRFNSTPIDRDDRASVLQGVNNEVVYQQNLDVTGIIIAELNKGAPQPDRQTRNNGNQVPRFNNNPNPRR